jgi:hypothetical protein
VVKKKEVLLGCVEVRRWKHVDVDICEKRGTLDGEDGCTEVERGVAGRTVVPRAPENKPHTWQIAYPPPPKTMSV